MLELAVSAGPTPGTRARTYEDRCNEQVHAGATDPAKHRGDVRGTGALTGQDGYTAVITFGALSPELKGKQVSLPFEQT